MHWDQPPQAPAESEALHRELHRSIFALTFELVGKRGQALAEIQGAQGCHHAL